MDLFKALIGKNPAEYENAAKILVDTPDVELFKKLVKQDDFLFDFVKNNVSKRIAQASDKDNFKNILSFFNDYSASYDCVFAEILNKYGININEIKELYINGNEAQKAYAAKVLVFSDSDSTDLIEQIRINAHSDFEPLANNSIELLAKLNDEISKNEAITNLDSDDEFEKYNAVKFLVTYGAKDALPKILKAMKTSTLAENISLELPFLIPLEELLEQNIDDGILVLCNIISAVPEIVSPSIILDYNLYEILEKLYYENLTSSSALLLRMAKDKLEALTENEEYLFDCDKNTKDEVFSLHKFLSKISSNKLNSLLYDELYDESDFVFFAVDYADNVEELETLLDSSNQTLLLKVLTKLKEKQLLNQSHKDLALNNITKSEIRQIVEVL